MGSGLSIWLLTARRWIKVGPIRNARPISTSARNLADWHDASLTPLGVETSRSEALWSRRPMPPSIYLSAFTLSPLREAPGVLQEIERLAERDPDAPLVLWDTFDELDPTSLGFRRMGWVGEWWFKGAAARCEEPAACDVVIERVEDEAALRQFGVAIVEGFESDETIRAAGPLGMHHPGTLADPRMRYFVGRVEGRVVTSSIAYVGDDAVGIYGLSTLPEHRRRGYGKAVFRAAALSAPELDVVVQPDEMARRIATELGFRKAGEFAPWVRKPLRS